MLSLVDEIKPKTMEDWLASNKSWNNFCAVGTLVDKSIYEYFLNILPPITYTFMTMQVGEPVAEAINPETNKLENTYSTFAWIADGVYMYCGECFKGSTKAVSCE